MRRRCFANLGLTHAVKGKTKLSTGLAQGQALIAKGEIDLGLFNPSEIPRAPGIVRAVSCRRQCRSTSIMTRRCR